MESPGMIMDFLVSIFLFLVVDPMEADVRAALERAQVPAAVVADVTGCIRSSGQDLAERAWSDPVWGATTAISVAIGMTSAADAVGDVAPQCAAAIDQAMQAVNETQT
jgi:hypothetical protein